MAQKSSIYKCEVCGNIVEVLTAGAGALVCCGKEMTLLEEKNIDQGQEKHKPVIEKTETGIKVKVGSIPHPMEEGHYIAWIAAIAGNKVYRKFLNPGQTPEAEFCIKDENVIAKEYCTLHGLWKS